MQKVNTGVPFGEIVMFAANGKSSTGENTMIQNHDFVSGEVYTNRRGDRVKILDLYKETDYIIGSVEPSGIMVFSRDGKHASNSDLDLILPEKITPNKKYKMQNGTPVEIVCIDSKYIENYPVIGIVSGSKDLYLFTAFGKKHHGAQSQFDLVEYTETDDCFGEIKVGDKFLTRDGETVLVIYTENSDEEYPIIGIIAGEPYTWTENGSYIKGASDAAYDFISRVE